MEMVPEQRKQHFLSLVNYSVYTLDGGSLSSTMCNAACWCTLSLNIKGPGILCKVNALDAGTGLAKVDLGGHLPD